MTYGGGNGTHGYVWTEDDKQKLSEVMKKYFEENPEAGKKHSERLKKHYEENPEVRKEHGEKIRQAKLGKKRDQNIINKIIQTKASKHNIQPNLDLKGQHKSNSQKSIIQYDLQNNLLNEYQSAQDAGRCLGKSGNSIADCAAGRQKTAYGYIWKYLLP
jgi:hypothetical protein